MILASCNSTIYNIFLYPVKNMMTIILIAAPIILIISLLVIFTKGLINPDDKKVVKKVKNAIVATIFVFLVSCIVTVVMKAAGNSTDYSSCWNKATKVNTNPTYEDVYEKEDKKTPEIKIEKTTSEASDSSNIAVNGEGVERILDSAKKVSDYAESHNWFYSNSRPGKSFNDSKKTKKTNCAHFVSIILQEAGYLDKGNTFWSSKDGKTHWNNKTEKNVRKNFNVINVNYDTSFKLQQGDVILFSKGYRHVALYAGKVNGKPMWYDAGTSATKNHKSGSVFTNLYRTRKIKHEYIRQVFRLK